MCLFINIFHNLTIIEPNIPLMRHFHAPFNTYLHNSQVLSDKTNLVVHYVLFYFKDSKFRI